MKRSLAAVAISVFAAAAHANAWDQEWRVKPSSRADQVHFTIESTSPGHRWMNSSDVPFDRFRGLTADVVKGRGATKFEYVRDAGSLVCTGHFGNGLGIGTFQFAPNEQFRSELERLGYDRPADDQMLRMTLSNVSLELARGLKSAGVMATTKQLTDMGIHGVTTELVNELKRAGFNPTPQEIVEMRIHGVSPEFIQEVHSYGMRPASREIVNMRIHGVRPEFLREAKELGFRFNAKDFTEMRIHGVDGNYLRKLKAAGYQNLPADKIVQLRIHGVD